MDTEEMTNLEEWASACIDILCNYCVHDSGQALAPTVASVLQPLRQRPFAM
jgi:hypothetical protein